MARLFLFCGKKISFVGLSQNILYRVFAEHCHGYHDIGIILVTIINLTLNELKDKICKIFEIFFKREK